MSEEIIDKKKELINSTEFDQALETAANVKKEILTSCKDRNKSNYARFYDIMVMTNKEIQDILDTKKRDRTDEDNNKLKEFKKDVSATYKSICELITPENLEEGELSKVQKMVQKITRVVHLMSYIGHNEIENEFKKSGIVLDFTKLEDKNDAFQNETIKENVTDVFNVGKNIREDINNSQEEIKTNIYIQSVPADLQFDKQANPTGIKASDFTKLVDIKTKMLMATTDEAKEKVNDAATTLAGDYQFANARNNLIQAKIMEIIPDED